MTSFCNFYGMRMNPFDKEISSKDAFLTEDMQQMQGRLTHLREHPGIGLFSAAPGQGKTFCLRYFSEQLNPNLVKFYYICLSTVTTSEFYRQLCVKLGLEVSYKKTVMFQRIQDYFYSMCMNKHVHCMVCLDEAQYLNQDILKDLKMLCNFCMELAGATPRIFDDAAITAAYGSCNASLRQLNLILTKALTIGAQNHKANIDSDIVLAAVNDISLG